MKKYEFLAEAEKNYGPIQETEYKFRKIYFKNVSFLGEYLPHTNFPLSDSIAIINKVNPVDIVLTMNALCNFNEALYQLSHEVIHLLSPRARYTFEKRNANVLLIEEGVATFEQFMANSRLNLGITSRFSPKYSNSLIKYMKLIGIDKYAVKKIRKDKPCFYDWVPDDILKVLGYTREHRILATELCNPF